MERQITGTGGVTLKFDLPTHPELHPYLAAIATSVEFGRMRITRFTKELTPEQLAATPDTFVNSIATLALHVAATNINFAHSLKDAKVDADLKAEFKLDQPQSPLPVAIGETAVSLKEKLDRSTAMLIETLGRMEEVDLEKEVPFGGESTATMAFVLSVVNLHPHQHLGQILVLRRALGL